MADLKRKLKEESTQPYENFVHLKLQVAEGKIRLTDVVDVEQLLR